MIRSRTFLAVGILAVAASIPAGATVSAEINLSGDAVEAAFAKTFRDDWARWHVAWLHHEDNGDVVSAGLHATGPVGDSTTGQRIRLGLGGNLVYFTRGGQHGVALAIGGDVTYAFPTSERFFARGQLHYAPGVLTVGDGRSLREFGAEIGMRVIPRVDVFLGVRDVRGRFDDGRDAMEDRGAHVGCRIRF